LDRFYIDEEWGNQREQVELCRRELAYGTDPDFKSLASDSLARLQHQAAFLEELSSAAGNSSMQ